MARSSLTSSKNASNSFTHQYDTEKWPILRGLRFKGCRPLVANSNTAIFQFRLNHYKLSKSHAEKLVEARELSQSSMAPVAVDTLAEFVLRQEVEKLREDGSAGVHVPSLASCCGGENGSNVRPN